MNTQVEKIDSARRTLAGLISRLKETESNARSREWPHAGISGVARAYVIQQSGIARGLINSIAVTLGFRVPEMLEQPLEGSTVTCFIGNTMMLARSSGVSTEEAQEAAFASADQLKNQVSEIVRHVEAVIEGEETLDGRKIHHGALHYK